MDTDFFMPAVIQDVVATGTMATPKIPLGGFEEIEVNVAFESEVSTVYPTLGFDFYNAGDTLLAPNTSDVMVTEEYVVGAATKATRRNTKLDANGNMTLNGVAGVLDSKGTVRVKLQMGQIGFISPAPASIAVTLTNPTGAATKGLGMSVRLNGVRSTRPPIGASIPEQALQA